MDEELKLRELTPAQLKEGLSRIRRRRWLLWGVILIYPPLMVGVYKLNLPMQAVIKVIGVWLLLSTILMMVAAVARCPRCGNYFHMNGPTLAFLRKCLHCQLHICADRPPRSAQAKD